MPTDSSRIFSHPVLNIAHRGARSLAPENTLAAARKALQVGAHMWELDVGMTLDGELIVVHDLTLDRTSNVKAIYPSRSPWRVHDFTLKELQHLDFGSWFVEQDPFGEIASGALSLQEAKTYQGEPVLTLQDALTFTLEHDWLVNVEIKDLGNSHSESEIVYKVVSLVKDLNMADRVIISSFNHSYLERARSLHTEVALGVLVSFPHPNPEALVRKLGAQAYHPMLHTVTLHEISKLRQEGYHVLVWVVNDEQTMRDLMDAGVSGLFTDFPQNLARIVS